MAKWEQIFQEKMADLKEIVKRIEDAFDSLEIEEKREKTEGMEKESQSPNFWDEPEKAQKFFEELKPLQKMVETWKGLKEEGKGLVEMEEEGLEDEWKSEWEDSVKQLEGKLEEAEMGLWLNGKHDGADAILTIRSGTGGTDAMDWAEMMSRMFLRFFEKEGWKAEVISESAGEEAGLKNVSIEVAGENAFGLLKRERGTHRLIRLSPFNAKNLRQTSFAGVEVSPVIEKSDELEIDEKDLRVDTFRSSGAGGQHVNTTDSAVRITHLPTGIVTSCQNGRSQLQNREKAMQVLMGRLLARKMEEEEAEVAKEKGAKVAADFGSQIRTVTLHPYQQVKDHRTGMESSKTDDYLDGNLMAWIEGGMRGGF